MALGPFPPETPGDADETFLYPDELLDTYDNLLLSLEHPVTDEEARASSPCLGQIPSMALPGLCCTRLRPPPAGRSWMSSRIPRTNGWPGYGNDRRMQI